LSTQIVIFKYLHKFQKVAEKMLLMIDNYLIGL
jgi:hypothetical protein